MAIHIQYSKVMLLILVALLGIGAVCCFFQNQQNDSVEATMAAFDKQSKESKLLVYLFLDEIRELSNLFYEPYYTIVPTVAYYLTVVSDIKDNGPNIEITFHSLPYIGPHDTIGEDEIIFQISYTGETVPVSFRHLKSFPLPNNLISLQKELPSVG